MNLVLVLLLLLLLQLQLLHQHRAFLVLTALVLKPDTDDSRTESGHLDELLLHQGVRSRVGAVAGAQRVKLFLVQYRPYPRRLLVGTLVRPRSRARRVSSTALSANCTHHRRTDAVNVTGTVNTPSML